MLRFYFGPSGAGKSYRLYEEIVKRSLAETEKDYLIIVPDQFTMQTQMDIVKDHPDQGIMNIDVLSFGRLSHRIFQETGERKEPVLDDVGKSLILRHVAEMNKADLPVIGGHMHRAGYIDEVKSTISELMQYDVTPEDMDILLNASAKRGALNKKLKDLQLLYRKFIEYTEGKYVTSEETLSILCDRLLKSQLVKDSVIVFDGFTGFTPIQYRVIERLLELSGEVIVTLDLAEGMDPYEEVMNEQELFFLSKKTIVQLEKTAWIAAQHVDPLGTPDLETWKQYRRTHNEDVIVPYTDGRTWRLKDTPAMAFLEEHLFRYTQDVYKGDINNCIRIAQCSSQEEEVRQALIHISQCVRENPGLFYRDFAIVCGDLAAYDERLKREAEVFHIPVYIDQTSNIRLNPFIEYIKSALNIVRLDYSYETVFHFMRSGMLDFSGEDIDQLENYVRALGIRGHKAWEDIFTRHLPKGRGPAMSDENAIRFLEKMNRMRVMTVELLRPLMENRSGTILEMCRGLYEFASGSGANEKLLAYAEAFAEEGDLIRSGEYTQIYRKIMDLLDQLASLMGDEKIPLKEFMEILDAGFGEIEVGTIPQNVDHVTVGDIERSRLSDIKYLLFLGVNDTAIPKHAGEGGILSDIDREFLSENADGVELAPTPRQQMYIQRLYLYMNLTKPSRELYLSYAGTSGDGKSMRPAYLIGKLKGLFPALSESMPETAPIGEQLQTLEDATAYAAARVREYADGILSGVQEKEFLTLYDLLRKEVPERMEPLCEAAFLRYQNTPLPRAIASALYGDYLENSVSRLELFASCCYAHFIRYGLQLDEREEYSFDSVDLGNVFHSVLEQFAVQLEQQGLDWMTFTSEEGEEILNQVIHEVTEGYGETILYSTARNRSAIERMHRILSRTVQTLQYQLQKGSFKPERVELDFREAGNIDEVNITLSEEEKTKIRQKMQLHGRIDRLDLAYDEEQNIYVKVIDFKSGKHSFDIASVYYGLQLQLVLYMNVASAMEKNEHPDKEVIPAAILYYHVADPLITGDGVEESPENINARIRKELCTTGIIQADDKVVALLDHDMENADAAESDVIPVKRKKGGAFAASSKIMQKDDYAKVSSYVNKKIREYGRRILDGDIEINPYEMKDRSACTYCSFHAICGFDAAVEGYHRRELESLGKDEVMARMKQELED